MQNIVRRFARKIWHRVKRHTLSGKGGLHIQDESILNIFDHTPGVECVATGMVFTEGPLWIDEGEYLLFSDIPGNRIMKLDKRGKISTWWEESGNANGLARSPRGGILVCQHRLRRLLEVEPHSGNRVVADRYTDLRLNSPNDVVTRSDGTIYFTDPPFGISPSEQELPFQGLFMVTPAEEKVVCVADDLDRPNGLAFSVDEKHLFVDDSAKNHIRIFNVSTDGSLAGGDVFFTMTGSGGSADGMKVDILGNIYCTGPGGLWVVDPSGRHLGTLFLPEKPSNCAFGGVDRTSLFITAESSLYRVKVRVPGRSV